MEADTRRLQPVKIGMSSVETGRSRFTRDFMSLPRASSWRNNLTALSQRYNLYFVALETLIKVYQPRFPFQLLGEEPCLTIPPTLAEPNAHGYIDARQSHTINHIIVGDLGTEEILLVATDSGNVAAYHTKAIRDAIEKDPYKYSADARSDFVGVRAFFSHWVHESAWGLAIHKEARMIAVSANTPYYIPTQDEHAKITVFAFALSRQDNAQEKGENGKSTEPLEQLEWKAWAPNPYEPWLGDRSQNYKTVLSGHIANIPNISFVNSSHDRDGSWLLSTDIGGRMKLWHIWIRRCYKSWDFSIPESPATALEGAVEHGWLVLALDPASFIQADTLEELCGSSRPLKYHKHTETPESYDMTNWVRTRVPNSSQLHPAFGAFDDDAEETSETDTALWEGFPSDDEVADLESGGAQLVPDIENRPENGGEAMVEDAGLQINENIEGAEEVENGQAEGVLSNDADQVLNLVHTTQDSPHLEPVQSLSESELNHLDEISSTGSLAQTGSEDTSSEGIGAGHTTYSGPPMKKRRHSERYKEVYEAFMAAKAARASPGLQPIAQLPVIQCSASHIRLINVPRAKTPHFFCAHALKQTLPPHLDRSPLIHMDRLNMMQYIPELGIVVIATQIGRCAVCTLTKKSDTGTPGFRVDWILPTKRQEREGLRPPGPLLGLAAGPVQGRQIGEEDSSSSDTDSSSETSSSSSSDQTSSSTGDRRQRRQKPRPSHKRGRPDLPINNHLPNKPESWRGIEHSRRYRLMLTYYDQTVLTYEIWREAPEIGIDGRKNWRNQHSVMVA